MSPFPEPLTRSCIRTTVGKTENANKRVHASWDGERFEHRSEKSDSLKLEVQFLFTNHRLTVETNARYMPGALSGFDE